MSFFKSILSVESTLQNCGHSSALIAKNLIIARGDIELCSLVNFSVSSGQILHVQGANGIGKTTLLMMLAGLIPLSGRDRMQLMWGGRAPRDWSVLYIGHLAGLNSSLSVGENLRFMQGLNSSFTQDLDEALTAVGLFGYQDIAVAQLSSGQKRRVSLARLWLSADVAQLWILDEPFTALDRTMIQRLEARLIRHTQEGGRVILTSHQPLNIPTQVVHLEHYAFQQDHMATDIEWSEKC